MLAMAATGVCAFATGYSPVSGRNLEMMTSFRPILLKQSRTRAFAVSTLSEQASTVNKPNSTTSTLPQNTGKFQEQEATTRNVYANMDELPEEEEGRKTLKDFFEACKEFIGSDGGPPRWFSPLECGCRAPDSPLLLFLPGLDGTGLGLLMHHQKLGKCSCTKPEVLLQSALVLRIDLQSPELVLGVDTPMPKSAIVGATLESEN